MMHRGGMSRGLALLLGAGLATAGAIGFGALCDLRGWAGAESWAAFELEVDWALGHPKGVPPGPWARARIGWHRGVAAGARGLADLAGVPAEPTREELLERLIREHLRRRAGCDPH